MKATYDDFLAMNPKCGKDLIDNLKSQAIFNLLSTDENIIAMIDASEAGKPAITAVVCQVENLCSIDKSYEFDLSNEQRRTVVGCMIKTILSSFGYIPVEPATRTQKDLPKSIGAKFFKSGSCYFYDSFAYPTMKIVRTIESIDEFNLRRIIKCPYCKTKNRVDFEGYCIESSEEGNMGTRNMFDFDYDELCVICEKHFHISGHISEYPLGSLEFEDIKISPTHTQGGE